MLKTYRIIPLVFILCLFGFTLFTESPVLAEDSSEFVACQQIKPRGDFRLMKQKKDCFRDVAKRLGAMKNARRQFRTCQRIKPNKISTQKMQQKIDCFMDVASSLMPNMVPPVDDQKTKSDTLLRDSLAEAEAQVATEQCTGSPNEMSDHCFNKHYGDKKEDDAQPTEKNFSEQLAERHNYPQERGISKYMSRATGCLQGSITAMEEKLQLEGALQFCQTCAPVGHKTSDTDMFQKQCVEVLTGGYSIRDMKEYTKCNRMAMTGNKFVFDKNAPCMYAYDFPGLKLNANVPCPRGECNLSGAVLAFDEYRNVKPVPPRKLDGGGVEGVWWVPVETRVRGVAGWACTEWRTRPSAELLERGKIFVVAEKCLQALPKAPRKPTECKLGPMTPAAYQQCKRNS